MVVSHMKPIKTLVTMHMYGCVSHEAYLYIVTMYIYACVSRETYLYTCGNAYINQNKSTL